MRTTRASYSLYWFSNAIRSQPRPIVCRWTQSIPAQAARACNSSLATSSMQHAPSFAPKSVIDVKHIRQNIDEYSRNCIDRKYAQQSQHPYEIAELFEAWQELQRSALATRQANNKLQAQLKSSNKLEDGEIGRKIDRNTLLAQAMDFKAQLQAIEEQDTTLQEQIQELASALPNLTSKHTPRGDTPKVLGYVNGSGRHPISGGGEQAELLQSSPVTHATAGKAQTQRSHVEIGTDLDILDFGSAAHSSGWGWYFLKNEAALLEAALVQYALSVTRRHGFTITSPPSMVYQHIANSCGFRPRDAGGESQIYEIAGRDSSKPTLVMAGTAEIPFAATQAQSDIEETELPMLLAGSSRCYRAEAGSHGASTKGLYRVHEFTKVEMFGWTRPEPAAADALFDKMLGIQKEILGSLGLYCRVLEQPSADLGASASRKQDIEAWFPSRQQPSSSDGSSLDDGVDDSGWGEVTSTSICTDYQTRRLATRMKRTDGSKTWPYTVNGTALAVPRILAALLETHWHPDEDGGHVRIPEVLWPWMHGVREIRSKKKPRKP